MCAPEGFHHQLRVNHYPSAAFTCDPVEIAPARKRTTKLNVTVCERARKREKEDHAEKYGFQKRMRKVVGGAARIVEALPYVPLALQKRRP